MRHTRARGRWRNLCRALCVLLAAEVAFPLGTGAPQTAQAAPQSRRVGHRPSPLEAQAEAARAGEERGGSGETLLEASEFPEVGLGAGPLERPIDPDLYTLGPGDELLIVILGGEPIRHVLPILPEGVVFVPLVGPIEAGGLTLTAFRESLRETLRTTYRNVDVFCYLFEVRTFLVYVTGQVATPGAVVARGYDRVSDVIREAGGVFGEGSIRAIEVRVDEEAVAVADLWAFEHRGEYDRNPVVESGQSIYVPYADRLVSARGRIRKGGRFELTSGEELGTLIEMAGGLLPGALEENIRIERIEEDGSKASFRASASDTSFHLKDRDAVIVPAGDVAEPSVFVEGEGHWQGRLSYEEGDRVSDLLAKIGDFSQQTDIDRVTLERSVSEVEVQILPVDVRGILDGSSESANFLLKEGDVLNVPERSQAVYLAGSVKIPGPVPYNSTWTVERYIAAAGGPEERSGFTSYEIITPTGKRRSAQEGDSVFRGETIYLKTRTGQKFVDVLLAIGSLTALVLSIIAVANIGTGK